MNCREAVEHLYEYLDKELTPAVEREVRDHLEDCHPCLEQFDFEEEGRIGLDDGRHGDEVRPVRPDAKNQIQPVGISGLGEEGLGLGTQVFENVG